MAYSLGVHEIQIRDSKIIFFLLVYWLVVWKFFWAFEVTHLRLRIWGSPVEVCVYVETWFDTRTGYRGASTHWYQEPGYLSWCEVMGL